ncbi:MAG: hypothetical protein AAGE94_26370, partial [Acidobacteriota bacterium]
MIAQAPHVDRWTSSRIAVWPCVVLLLTSWIVTATPSRAEAPSCASHEWKTSPCAGSIKALADAYRNDARTRAAFEATFKGLKPLPPGYEYHGSTDNPWTRFQDGAGLAAGVGAFYERVCTLLPQIIGTNDNALDSIQYFAWLYYDNRAGRQMVEGIDPHDPTRPLTTVQDFLIQFNAEYKA